MIAAELHNQARYLRKQRLHLLYKERDRIPEVHYGHRLKNGNKIQVVRIYPHDPSCSKKKMQYDVGTPQADALVKAAGRREEIQNEISRLRFRGELDYDSPHAWLHEYMDSSYREPIKSEGFDFSREAFDKLVEKNDQGFSKVYPFDGRLFRSKSEMITAQLLRSLDLDYKYEVEVHIGNHMYYVDFAVYCKETGRYFFIEHFGMMDDESYRIKTWGKISTYLTNGFREGLDILFIYENWNAGFYRDISFSKILGIVMSQNMLL